jgi:tetratricopeptide (TPR) repeat protein
MKKLYFILFSILIVQHGFGQTKPATFRDSLLAELSAGACNCIDSLSVYNKSRADVAKEIHRCIADQVSAYQLGAQLMNIDLLKDTLDNKDGKKQINITLNTDENSQAFKDSYYEMERYLMTHCPSLKQKIAANDKLSDKSFSANPDAQNYYSKGLDESKADNHKKAIKYFEKAVKIDPEFAFAWDNMGLAYRKLGDYDKALEFYKKSLEIDPSGTMPLQNSAIVYQYKKEFQLAIDTYEKLAAIDKQNPEIYYGIGQIYATQLKDPEKGLSFMCKAYNLYVEQKSPYRSDAEKLIQFIYSEMKKENKEERFNEILKENNISTK